MTWTTLGIDVAKQVFQLHGVAERGHAVVQKRVSRSKLRETAAQAGVWIYKNLLQPVASVFSPVVRGVWGTYGKLWQRVVYTTNAEGEREFVKKRAVAMTLVTVFAATQISKVLNSIWQCALWAATRRTEKMYMNQSEELSNSFHSAKGCHELPCTPENSRYYKISDSYFHDLRDVLLKGHRYYPDLVAAGIPAVTSECTVTSYGFRQKFFSGFKQMWPILLETQCQPLSVPSGTSPAQASDAVGTRHANSPVATHPAPVLPKP